MKVGDGHDVVLLAFACMLWNTSTHAQTHTHTLKRKWRVSEGLRPPMSTLAHSAHIVTHEIYTSYLHAHKKKRLHFLQQNSLQFKVLCLYNFI